MVIAERFIQELLEEIEANESTVKGALHQLAGYVASRTKYQHRHARQIVTTLIGDWETFDRGVSPIFALAILARAYE